jgi:sulfoxide reductase catalytic subunit YedY
MHPLTLIAVGLYGKTLPESKWRTRSGWWCPGSTALRASSRLLRSTSPRQQPKTSWQTLQPSEYGFYANVNPEVDHPRWSQRFERKLPSSIFKPNRVPPCRSMATLIRWRACMRVWICGSDY